MGRGTTTAGPARTLFTAGSYIVIDFGNHCQVRGPGIEYIEFEWPDELEFAKKMAAYLQKAYAAGKAGKV